MAEYFSGIKPSDGFYVKSNYNYTHVHQDILVSLYTPLIGTDAIGVYLYLSQFNYHHETEAYNHYTIMNDLRINLSSFRDALDLLEGIGLLKTYFKTNQEAQSFIYQLEQPATAEQFFNDPLLSVFLYQQIGKSRYIRLKNRYKDDSVTTEGFHEVTKSFTDVFKVPKLTNVEQQDDINIRPEYKSKGLDLSDVQFDFEMLELLLSNHLISKEILNKQTKEVIIQIATLYGITPVEMKSIILKSITENQTISLQDLRKHARTIYQIEHEGELPTLDLKNEKPKTNAHAENSEVNSLLSWFELLDTTSPIDVLSSFTQSEPTISQKRTVEDIITREKLPYGVINILLEYVMFKNNMQLPKAYIEEIASNWKKLKLSSAEEAYHYVKNLDKQKAEKKKERKSNANNPYKLKSIEKTPEWLLKQKSSESTKEEKQNDHESDAAFEKRKQALQKEMEAFWKEGDQ
ncbi:MULTISPECIES: DnaD domain protein [Mammaliicoccus]|uniref:DnaD domain protein n=1 Tax=Mammaliicoccus sciuri TaxID=1296 RepID=A0ABT7HT61_MAMSC|nr:MULTISPECIES: DnaD domain protein [Mammaliicoccus]MCJ0914151.1 DnaD domain protein [Mammaliicoccus sciuri]MCJ0941793.1 DnaD domain protein [Mammaliicoccus sciuri]MCJ1763380.1 DnaD domain protein [Mammaliicoccus sciuri]MCJ1772163.1 DnaD domain protein [Mammaliicoccus sciuri]MCJ1784336.1 DnaD domain protein [Mammaliicoccus sciuri]